jgi:hypothetical protein
LGALGLAAVLQGGPVFVCEPAAVDVGAVGPTDKPVAEFRIRNTGDAPLLLSKTRAGCPACMTIECPDQAIPPGGAAALKVTLTGLPPSGPVRKLLYLATNDPAKAEVQLTVSGSVRGAYALTPNPTFALGETEAGKEQSWDYELAVTGAKPCAVTAVEVPAGLAVRTALNRSAQRHALRLTTVPGKLPAGVLTGLATIRTDSPALPLLRVPLSLLVRGPVMPAPASLMLGIPPDEAAKEGAAVFPPVRQRFGLVASSGPVPAIARVEAPAGVVVRVATGPKATVEVSLEPGAKSGPLGDLIVHLADAALPPVRVPVFAVPAKAATAAEDDGGEARAAARSPLPFDVLLARLGQHLGCSTQAVQAGGFKDERTQLVVWLAERLCDPAVAERQARRSALGGMSLIEYARARDEVTLRLQRDPEFKVRCEKTLAAVGTEETGPAGK